MIDRFQLADNYEALARRSPGAFAIVLPEEPRPFWSKGWRGCEFNCTKAVDDWAVPMVMRVTIGKGYITRGFYCR